jgi:uncharacterized membrane protein YGL010W
VNAELVSCIAGRKPAITDSLFQAIVSPFFLVLEALFAFGT